VSVYVDASALLKVYVEESESVEARRLLVDPTTWTTGRHTVVEVRRNLARVLTGPSLERIRTWFEDHWVDVTVVELNELVCNRAAELAELTGVRTMDALHLGAAEQAGAPEGLPIVTFDRGMRAAAHSLGWRVLPE